MLNFGEARTMGAYQQAVMEFMLYICSSSTVNVDFCL